MKIENENGEECSAIEVLMAFFALTVVVCWLSPCMILLGLKLHI